MFNQVTSTVVTVPTPTPTPALPTNTPTPTPPGAPSLACSVDSGSCSCTADTQPTWNFSSNASSVSNFKVYRGGDFPYQGVIDCSVGSVDCNLAARSGSFTPLVPKNTGVYTLQVSAVNDGGEGAKSGPVSVTIDTTAPRVDMNCTLASATDSGCTFSCRATAGADSSCSSIEAYQADFTDSTGGAWLTPWRSYSAVHHLTMASVMRATRAMYSTS